MFGVDKNLLLKKSVISTDFRSFLVLVLFLVSGTTFLFGQTEYINVDTGYQGYGNENVNHTTNVPLSSNLLNTTAPAGGYRLSFSWASNNGQEGEACYSGGQSASLYFQILVNGTQYWWAQSPSDQNGVSGDNRIMNGASWVSGTTGNWNMTCGTAAQNPNVSAEIRLPTSVNRIYSIQLKLHTVNPNGRGADDGILRLNSVVTGAITNTCAVQTENSFVSTGYQGYGNENVNHTTNVPLSSNILNSTQPSGGYRLSFSWAANNGQEGEACYSGGQSASLGFGLYVNGTQFWWAASPSNQNGESGDNQVRNGANWVSGTTGIWQMTCNTAAQNPNRTAEIRLPTWVTSINRIELRLNTINPNGRGADDGILRLNNVSYCRIVNTTNAVNDSYSTDYNTGIQGNVLDNDSDPEGNGQNVVTPQISGPSNGSLILNTNGTFTYTPNANFSGTDSFRYRVCDNVSPPNQACDEATVTITVNSFSPPDYSPTINEGQTIINGGYGTFDFVIAVEETQGNLPNMVDDIEVRIPHNENFTFTFSTALSNLNGYALDNGSWTYIFERGLHKFRYTGNSKVFPRGSISNIGINATFTSPSSAEGRLPLKATIKSNSGGQTNTSNDNDQVYITYYNY